MTVTNKQDIAVMKTAIIDAALTLAARHSWNDVTMREIAVAAEIQLADLLGIFDDKSEIVAAYGRSLDAQIAESAGMQSLENDTAKDRLFDVIMERFDLMNDHRDAVISMMDAMTSDPKHLVMALPNLCKSVTWMMEISHIPIQGWSGAARIAVITGIYAKVLRDWVGDDSEDMAATMASLDKALGKAEQLASYLKI